MSDELTAVRAAAAEVFTPAGVDIWMVARNRLLDGRSPVDMIEDGEAQRVLDLIEMLASGSFS